jgi:hypothetical protein
MVDEIALQREVTLGNKAKALLENDILNASWNEIEAGLIQKWINTSLEDVAVREETWHLLRLTGARDSFCSNMLRTALFPRLILRSDTPMSNGAKSSAKSRKPNVRPERRSGRRRGSRPY